MKLLCLHASVEVEICVRNALLTLYLIAKLRARWVEEETGALFQAIESFGGRRCVFDDRICLSQVLYIQSSYQRHTSHILVHESGTQDPETFRLKTVRRGPCPVRSNVIVLLATRCTLTRGQRCCAPCRPDCWPGADVQLLALCHERPSRERIGVLATDQTANLPQPASMIDFEASTITGSPDESTLR